MGSWQEEGQDGLGSLLYLTTHTTVVQKPYQRARLGHLGRDISVLDLSK